MRRLCKRLGQDRRGAVAVELALVLPGFVLLTAGSLGAATLGFSVASLHYAVEDAARCAAVKTTICTDSATTAAFAQSRYQGLPIAAVFSYSTSPCAHTVSATGTLSTNLIPQLSTVPLSATACYP